MSKKKRRDAEMRRQLRQRKRELWREYQAASAAAQDARTRETPGTGMTVVLAEIAEAEQREAAARKRLATFSRAVMGL